MKAQDKVQDFSYCLYKNIDIDPIYDSELLNAIKLVVVKVDGNQYEY